MKQLVSFLLSTLSCLGAFGQYHADTTPNTGEPSYHNQGKSLFKSRIRKSTSPSSIYIGLNIYAGQAPYKSSDFAPKVQFDYTVDGQPYHYADSLHRPMNYNNPVYWGFGIEVGKTKGFFGGFGLRVADYHRYSLIGMLSLEVGYNLPIFENLSIHPSLSACWMETDLTFPTPRVIGNNLSAFGNAYNPLFGRYDHRMDGDVTLLNDSFGLMPKFEVSYAIPVQNSFLINLKFGAAMLNQNSQPFQLDLNATPRVSLTTPGLQFADGNVATDKILHYSGLMWNFTIALKGILNFNQGNNNKPGY